MPAFIRHGPLRGRNLQVIYADTNPNAVYSETKLPADAHAEPKDGMAGAGFVELKMTKLLSFT
jgi:hypothetical protein